ncbi:MAG: hypothetical protein WAN51_12795 [Alphaproteobacteria bacterium]
MSRQRQMTDRAYLLFDVVYDDGQRTSNRKVPSTDLQPWDFDGSVRAILEAQDRDISDRSGKPRSAIKSITPSSGR